MGPRRHMHRYEIPQESRFLTCSCYRRFRLMGTPTLRDLFAEHLAATRDALGFRLLGWVAMPEHFHLLLVPRPPEVTVSRILSRLKTPMARRVIARWRELDARVLERITDTEGLTRFWQKGGGHDRNVRDDRELYEKLEYIHWNPVKRGLVKRPEDWAWSSARWYRDIDRDRTVVRIDPLELPRMRPGVIVE